MKSAYYAKKLPKYEEALKNGDRKMVTLFTARKIIRDLCKEYNVKAIIAHNSRFDYNALNTSIRYITKSKYRLLSKNSCVTAYSAPMSCFIFR